MGDAVGYCRVSTVLQAAEGVSLEAQQARIVRWCDAEGHTLRGVFVDRGLSGRRADNRPELQAALTTVCEAGGVLVVYSLSRLARSVMDAIAIADRLRKADANLVSLCESLDTTSAGGNLVFRILAVLAQFESEIISERTRAALAYKRARGERLGQVPYGRTLADDGRSMISDLRELAAIDCCDRLRAEGLSLRRIAGALDQMGFRPKNGGATWSASSVRHILRRGLRPGLEAAS